MGNFIFWVVNDYSENEIPKKMFADEALKDTDWIFMYFHRIISMVFYNMRKLLCRTTDFSRN